MASEKRMKAELLTLRMGYPEVLAKFERAKRALWEMEERMDRLKTGLALKGQARAAETGARRHEG